MKRKKLSPEDINQIENSTAFRLSDDDLAKLHVTIAGFDFIVVGGTLICPTCGQPQKVFSTFDPDEKVNFFLRFLCLHYDQTPQLNTGVPVDPNTQTTG